MRLDHPPAPQEHGFRHRGDRAAWRVSVADETYAELLAKLANRDFEGIPAALRCDVLAFYGPEPRPPTASKSDRKQWECVQTALMALSNSR